MRRDELCDINISNNLSVRKISTTYQPIGPTLITRRTIPMTSDIVPGQAVTDSAGENACQQ